MPPRVRTTTAYKPILPPHRATPPPARPPPPKQLPFFRDPLHTIPTKWSLYRPLLRATRSSPGPSDRIHTSDTGEDDNIENPLTALHRGIREHWRKHRISTSIQRTRLILEKQYSLLALLQTSDPSVLSLNKHLSAIQRRADAHALALKQKPRPTYRLQGSFIRPTLHNPPLPRLRPMPVEISMMILKRQAAHARRIEQYRKWTAWGSDMQREASLWRGLGAADEEWGQGWEEEPRKMLKGMEESFERGRRREGMKFSREMVGRVEEARKRRERRKQAWGMRRREEAARGVDGAAGGEPEVSERREKAVETGTSTSST